MVLPVVTAGGFALDAWSMRLHRFAFLLLACAHPAPPPPAAPPPDPVTGRWQGDQVRDDGGRLLYQFVLRQDGAKLTGAVYAGNGSNPISDGTISGADLTFVVKNVSYKARRSGEDLMVVVPGGRDTSHLLTAHRVSREPSPPPKPPITLPELRELAGNGLARTPPMGWNSWNKFRTKIEDKLIREIADAMVTSGMKAAGYQYINIDDGWEGTRDAAGHIRSNERFPDMKALADYVHDKGLKLGIYSSPGFRTCAGFEGSLNHEADDARAFAAWGIDYLKYDWCTAPLAYEVSQMQAAYQKMGEALAATGRPIVYSLCQYGREHVERWGAAVGGNLWRTTGDISDRWDKMSSIGFDKQAGLEAQAGPGHWNDPDMLEIGNGGMTPNEYRTHMSLWSMMAAPLVIGTDLRKASNDTLTILGNREIIAIDQDSLGKQAAVVSDT
ncbi:MAG TPA: glycoside hydrolase family 27 protein, partial [Polyangia bacterium]|nr:glycoside hydrolase family 27 protein [Polyangia bacterium]